MHRPLLGFALWLALVTVSAADPAVVRRASQLGTFDGQVVEVEGLYLVLEPLPGAGNTTTDTEVVLQLPGGNSSVRLGVRPLEERTRYRSRTVRVTGRLLAHPTSLGPRETTPGPRLEEIESVRRYP